MSKPPRNKAPTKPTALETLNGSSTLPALVEIAEGKTVQLGQIVMRAHSTSGLTVEAWNALPEAERDELLGKTIAEFQADPDSASLPAIQVVHSDPDGCEFIVAEQVLVVSAPGGPRRRAGFSFGPVPVELRAEDLGDDPGAVVEALRADPLLKIDGRFEEGAKEDAQE